VGGVQGATEAARAVTPGKPHPNLFKVEGAHRTPLKSCPCHDRLCYHARTHRHSSQVGTPREAVGGHNDYLFASPTLAHRLTSLRVLGDEDESVWNLSDHCPVIAEFR
jgi:hypothetical protein